MLARNDVGSADKHDILAVEVQIGTDAEVEVGCRTLMNTASEKAWSEISRWMLWLEVETPCQALTPSHANRAAPPRERYGRSIGRP